MKIRDLMRWVEHDGWQHVRTTGSHRHYRHPTKPGTVTIPGHPSDEPARYRTQYPEAGWPEYRPGDEQMSDYLVIYEKISTGYSAYVPDLPGCITTGATLRNTQHNMSEALTGHLAIMREFGDPVPEPTTVAERLPLSA